MALAIKEHVPFGEVGLARVSEVADFLSTSRSKVYAMLEKGLLNFVDVDGSKRIPRADVHRYVNQQTVGSNGTVEAR